MSNDTATKAICCLIDFITECNAGGNTYSPPSKELCEAAKAIVNQAAKEAKS